MDSEFKAILFIVGFIWVITSAGSVVIGPFVGFNRKKVKIESSEIWQGSLNNWNVFLKRLMHTVAFLGFLLPAVYPVIGFIFGLLFIVFSS